VLTASTNTQPAIYVEVYPPHGSDVAAVTWYFQPNTGHGGGVPATQPRINVKLIDITTKTTSTLATFLDTAGGGAYENFRNISATVSPHHTFDATKERVMVELISEGGAGAQAGLQSFGIVVSYIQYKLV
jgi:hypothetical protein